MFWKIKVILLYLIFKFKAKSKLGHGIHSPFVYNFTRNVLLKHKKNELNKEIEKFRTDIYKNKEIITDKQFGAVKQSSRKTIGKHAKLSSSGSRKCKTLQKIVQFNSPQTIVELGTSVGISTAYMASVSTDIKVFTFEGNKTIAQKAKLFFNKLNLQNIVLQNIDFININFDFFDFSKSSTLFLLDGDHRYDTTINNINKILSVANEQTVIIIDDIRWSEEMYRAWNEIIAYKQITISIDLFKIGIITVRKTFQKEHFKISFF